MELALRKKLDQVSKDYEKVTGKSFGYFFCPILHRDEDTELCKAHIVNQAFPDPDNLRMAWTVQRKDVDNFYGTMFEADFTLLGYDEDEVMNQIFIDRDITKKFKPKILLNGEEVDSFVKNGEIPENFTPLRYENDEKYTELALKILPSDVQSNIDGEWAIEVAKDIQHSSCGFSY
ncbi:MAG TPA: hypothetical protein VHL11_03420 [Phototrophicaceae bacterium]|jgi:hypothetical protein|nr:hypothetical protein [Phototrophicaceae bacterium]